MQNSKGKWFFRILLLSSTSFIISCAMGHHHSVLVKGALISYVEKGNGGPTVVFEAGLGNGLRSWEPVFADVATFSRAVAYSRAGYAGNLYHFDRGGRRSGADVARMLRAMLGRKNISGPYVLVGHSIGGNYALCFAKMYPGEVAGIVLVDSRPRGFTSACEDAGLSPCGPSEIHTLGKPTHIAAEIRGLSETEDETPLPEELGDLPITVIAAEKPPEGAAPGIQRLWLRMQKDFAGKLRKGRYVEAAGAGHFIHHDVPELVVGEIRSMVDGLGDSKKPVTLPEAREDFHPSVSG